MQTIDMRLDQIKPYDKNPRQNDGAVDAVAESISTFGFQQPLVLDKDHVIIVGHTRYKAAQQLGLETVPCVVADGLTEEQVKAYRLADNKVGELAQWDTELLQLELDGIDMDMTCFGFDLGLDLDCDVEETEIVEDDFEAAPTKEPKAKFGEVYQLGRHRLMCGDSTSVEDVEKLMGGVKADLLLTDPPYNVAYEGKTKDKLRIENDSMGNDEFRSFLASAFFAADQVMKPGAVFYIWHADSECYNFRGACVDIGWKVRQCIIWNKNTLVMGRQDYQWKHEPCLYGWKEGAGHLWASDRKQTTVINWDCPTRDDIHPTMKPVGLFDYQIKNNTKGGDIVLDLFNGSGTTIMACEQNGRVAYTMELDPRYVDAAIERWEQFTGEKAKLLTE